MIARREYRLLVKGLRTTADGLDLSVEVVEVPNGTPETPKEEKKKADSGPKITENQRRFLFRLLAAQKVEGKDAEKHLQDYFKVRSVNDIPKDQASQYIDQLVRDQKGDGK